MSVRRTLALALAAAATVATFAVAMPATTAQALPCNKDAGCSNGKPRRPPGGDTGPSWKTGWILYADSDGAGSYWVWGVYYQDASGHCFDTNGTGVGCP